MLRLSEQRLNLFAIVKENFACSRKRDVGSSTIKELNANVLFQCLDLETHCGLRQVKLFGCLAKTELFRDCAEGYETEVFESRHSLIRTPALGDSSIGAPL